MLITKSLNSTRITSSDISLPAGRCPLRKVPGPFQGASNSIRMARWSRIIITIIIMDIRGTNMGMGDMNMMGTSMGTSMTGMDMGLMRTNMGMGVWVWAWGIIIMAMGDMRAGDMDMDMDIIMGMGMEVSMDGMG